MERSGCPTNWSRIQSNFTMSVSMKGSYEQLSLPSIQKTDEDHGDGKRSDLGWVGSTGTGVGVRDRRELGRSSRSTGTGVEIRGRRELMSKLVYACTPSDEDHGNGRRSDRCIQRELGRGSRSTGTVSKFVDACTPSDEGHGNGRRSDRCIQRELVSRFMDVFMPSAMVDDDQGWCNGN